MAASWTLKRQNIRSGRFQRSSGRHLNKEDDVQFNIEEDSRLNIENILSAICQLSDISDGKRLNFLNAFVKVTLHIEGNFENFGFDISQILFCLRFALVHESTQVRSGGLRAIRHTLRYEEDIMALNKLLIPFLIARSMDLVMKNDTERIEAMKLIRKILLLSPSNFHMALGRSLIALANGGVEEKDRMLRICLATLCELGVMNTELFIEIGGVAAITRNLLECQTPKIAESLCGVLLLLLDKPSTRQYAAVDLHSVAAPYCDFHYRHGWKDKDKYVDERELRFNCSRLALLSILRSWPGIIHFCSPSNSSGLKAIVDVLYLDQLEVRKAVLDLLYELLGLPQPEWTDELSVALSAVDPCEPQSSWRLNDGFVAAEGRSILPNLAKTVPSINDMHLALLLYCFVECGLLGAISEVIATSDTFISVRATVLLGELLRLIQILLPPECCNISPALPSLLEYASYGKPQALKAVNALQQLHKMFSKRPASYSLHLDYIVRSGVNMTSANKNSKKARHKLKGFKSKLQQLVNKDGDDVIKETGVLLNKDTYSWNWNLIKIILKGESIKIDITDVSHKNFLKRLLDFYTPSRNRYSHMDLTSTKISVAYTATGIDLIHCLLEMQHDESERLLREFLSDILQHIIAITSGKSVHDCLFSPQHMLSTQCQSYFLFIGRLTATETGIAFLNSMDIFKHLQHLATTTNNDCYVKLIISSMDYSMPGSCRNLLKAVLKCPIESSRLYCTQFLLVLLRVGVTAFSDWGVRLLVEQLQDKSRSVYLTALSLLHEACEIDACLETMTKLNPDLSHLGEKGLLLSIRLLSTLTGFHLKQSEFAINQLKYWDDYFNYRYVKLVEGETSDALTLHQRDEDGKYDKRTTAVRSNSRKDFFLPPHLYGQLARHQDGLLTIMRYGSLQTMFQYIENGHCESDTDIMQLKAALWAVGHFCSCPNGLTYLLMHHGLTPIVNLTETCSVYSIRATAFYVVGLISRTRQGADELFRIDWFSTRHHRHIAWPIIEEEIWNEKPEDSLQINFEVRSRESYMCFFEHSKEVEDKTEDDTSESLTTLPENNIHEQPKSLTLPINQTLSFNHKRSLSESKTFEIIRSYDSKSKENSSFRMGTVIVRRMRNNSTTDSTTSGVSSCDSVCGTKVASSSERQQILSPIPSSCSLSTLKQDQKIRRHSESSRRISVNSGSSSNKSSQSLAGSYTNQLSYQDLLGYTTLRSLRNTPRYLEEPSYSSDDTHTEISWDLTSSASDFKEFDWNFPSISRVKRFSISGASKNSEDQIYYMGVSLPKDIQSLFPKEVVDETCIFEAVNSTLEAESTQEYKTADDMSWTHESMFCWSCLMNSRDETEVFANGCDVLTYDTFLPFEIEYPDKLIKWEILRLVSRFSNPVWSKQVRQALVHWKQLRPHIFQDICLYSEVCRMLSENMYRLLPRRMVHELFFDVNFDDLYARTSDHSKPNLFGYVSPSSSSKEQQSGNSITTDTDETSTQCDVGEMQDVTPSSETDSQTNITTSIKNLESLRLAYKENKFPIRNRNASKIV